MPFLAKARVKRVLIGALIFLSLPYVADFVMLLRPIAGTRNVFGEVTIRPFLAVPQKNHKTEFIRIDPETQTCVHSLFPHFGYSPCWYLNRRIRKRIDM